METIILRHRTSENGPLEATFLPQMGMNLLSLKQGDLELIDQSTKGQFEERFAGLGALIGPHFHRRREVCVPVVKDESLFPHIARVKAKGIRDPFSHGIARYAPWQANAAENRVTATLSGKDLWNGVALSELEGQDFKMTFQAELVAMGLKLELSVVSSTDSVVGIHYYYALPHGQGQVRSRVKDFYLNDGQKMAIPSHWIDQDQLLTFDLREPADYTFYPYPSDSAGKIILETESYSLITEYEAQSQENGWQLYHPKGASFVCIEPISAQDPRHPNLSVSSLKINLTII